MGQRKPAFWHYFTWWYLVYVTHCGIDCDYVTFCFVFKAPANDLPNLLKVAVENGKIFLTLIGDNGPDMNPTSYINTYYFGTIW